MHPESSAYQLQNINVDLKDSHKVYSKVDIGFMAENSDFKVLWIRRQRRKVFANLNNCHEKVLEKTVQKSAVV